MKLQSTLEERIVEAAGGTKDELIGLAADLVACDTTARHPGDPARDEEKLQRLLVGRLEALGATTELWEPAPSGDGDRFVPAGLDFAGRPQLVAVVPGAGSGRSLLLNGHVDAVDVEPRDRWHSDPFKLTERDGYLFGRGANDMKGGLAALVIALETLRRQGVRLAGDIVFCTVTDEESSGAGGRAAVAHGVRADAGIAAEATGYEAWVSCRGTVTPTITVEGRAGHAEMPQADWRQGGAVNAIEKLTTVLSGVAGLRAEWKTRSDHRHPYLAPGDIVPTIVQGGTWMVTIPASCDLVCDITYLPQHVDGDGTGKAVEAEVIDRLTRAVAADPWFAEHPLAFRWTEDVVPAEMPADHPLVVTALGAAAALGHEGKPAGLDSWHDAATFTRAGTPTFSFGPDGIDSAHAVDERIEIAGLLDYVGVIALTIMRWCGVA